MCFKYELRPLYRRIHTKQKSFVSPISPDVQPVFQNIAFLDKVYSYVMASVGFMAMAKVNLLLAFDHRFTQMTRTLKKASKPIIWFSVVFFIVFFGFVALNYITMGADTKDYKSLVATSESLISTLLGKFRFSNFERDSGRELGMAIFAFYCIVQVYYQKIGKKHCIRSGIKSGENDTVTVYSK